MKRVWILVPGLVLAACQHIPLEPAQMFSGTATPETRRAQRTTGLRATPSIMQPVHNHVSDSIQDAFPALDPPVADEAIYGNTRPMRVIRARLPAVRESIVEEVVEPPRAPRMAAVGEDAE